MNEEIRIYGSIWRRELFVGVMCMAFAVILIINNMTKFPVAILFGLMGFILLFIVFHGRLMHRPSLTITDESITISRKCRKEIIRFDEIQSFERETLTVWKHTIYTGPIIVHMKNGHGFVHVISADSLAIKVQVLLDLLNERIKHHG